MKNRHSEQGASGMILKSKYFHELTTAELYEILRVRVKIFVVEQHCAYQEPDGKDLESLHIFYEENGQVLAYLRAFVKDRDTVQMGRVLTLHHGTGLGGKLLRVGIEQIREKMDPKRIDIEAQCYARGYYARAGFVECSEPYLEDGIPHVRMTLKL